MEITDYAGWTWITNSDIQQNEKIMGKYLFFSDNKEHLISLAKQILIKYGLSKAKVPYTDVPNNSKGFGFVLCVYDIKNRYCNDLRKFDGNGISFRYWKSDADTRKGKYSKQHLKLK